MKKRIFARALALFMALSLLSTTAFAASFTDLQNAIDGGNDTAENSIGDGRYGYAWNDTTNGWGIEAWTDGDNRNVQLNEDVANKNGTGSIVITENQDVTIDLGGNSIIRPTSNSAVGSNSAITVNGNLTLKDSAGGGVIDGKNEGQVSGAVVVNKDASFTMEGGKITGFAGGAAAVNVKGTFTMKDGEISDNQRSGVVVTGEDSNFTMENGTISGNKTTVDGAGGVTVKDGAEFTMTGGTIVDNKGGGSGGVDVKNATFEMTGGSIINNTNGGIRADNSTLTLEAASDEKPIEISGNTSRGFGAGIRMNGGTISIQNAVMENNSTPDMGAALWINGASDANVNNATINTSVRVSNATLNIGNSTLSGNIRVGGSGKLVLTDTILKDDATVVTCGGRGILVMNNVTMESGKILVDESGGDYTIGDFKLSIRYSGKEGIGTLTIYDMDGNQVDAILDANGDLIEAGELEPDCVLLYPFSPVPVAPTPGEDDDSNDIVSPVVTTFDSFTTDGGTSGTTISDNEIPLAGLISVAQLLNYLHEHDGIADAELPEDFQWADHEYAQAIYWGLSEELVINTEDEPLDPDEILTVAILREIMTNYAALLDTTFDVVIEDEDDMIVMNCDEILAEFYASLEDAAA